jgi:hypothetical protein
MGGPLHLSCVKGRPLHVVGSNKDATKPRRKRITDHAQEKRHVARKSPRAYALGDTRELEPCRPRSATSPEAEISDVP